MPKIVGNSFEARELTVSKSFFSQELILKFEVGFLLRYKTYKARNIKHVEEVSADSYRNLGAALGIGLVGGLLTGGLGLIIGAAYGGRRRTQTQFVIVFDDGEWVALETVKKAENQLFGALAMKYKAQGIQA